MKQIKLGYEVGTGKQVDIKPSHLIVTGLTQEAGKTTTLESLIKRSKKRAIVFRTKIGEKSFLEGTKIPPYFKDRCLVEGTKIFCKDKIKNIEDIKEGDIVLDKEGNFTKVINVFKNKLNGNLLEIKPIGLPRMTMTDNHPLLVSNRIKRHWKKGKGNYNLSKPYWNIAKKLDKQKHCLLVPRIKKENSYIINLSKYLKKGKLTGIKTRLKINVNEDFAWSLGFYMADGNSWSSDTGGYVRFYFGIKETDKSKRLADILSRNGFRMRTRKIKNMIEVSCSSKIFARFLKSEFNVGAFNKKIPSFIYELKKSLVKEFIKGWFDGDGCMSSSNGRDRFAGLTISDNIANGLTILGAKIGIPIMISKSKAPKSGFENAKERWIIEVSGDYAKDLGFKNLRQRQKERRSIKIDSDYLYHPIRIIKKNIDKREYVYNFETETHSYSTPIINHNSDWQFVQGLVEATIKEKLRSFERAKIIQVCKQTSGNSLLEFKKKVDERMEEKLSGFEKDILTNLQAYLEIVLPKLQSINFSKDLDLVDGLNIIDLERFSRDSEVQSLIIRSVVEEVLYNLKEVIVVIPEFWKFSPQKRGNPCKQIIEEFVRQGATNNNFIWIDAQDMSGVDKTPLKQVSTWILGKQSEINEVKHTLDQIPLPKKSKPKPEDIMNLGKGMFYLVTRETVTKTYVQPFWLDDERAKKVALGEIKISELDAPESKKPFELAVKQETRVTEQPSIDFNETTKRFNQELNDVRKDFFDKLQEIQEQFNKVYSDIFELKNQPKQELDEETIISKVLQKLPSQKVGSETPVTIDEESIISKVLARVPTTAGAVTYEVAPQEKIKKDFLEEAKQKILADIETLNDKEKKMLKYIESQGKGVKSTELIKNCFLLKEGGSARSQISQWSKSLLNIEVIKKDTGGAIFPILKERIKFLLETKDAKPEEIEQVYNHILMEMLK